MQANVAGKFFFFFGVRRWPFKLNNTCVKFVIDYCVTFSAGGKKPGEQNRVRSHEKSPSLPTLTLSASDKSDLYICGVGIFGVWLTLGANQHSSDLIAVPCVVYMLQGIAETRHYV